MPLLRIAALGLVSALGPSGRGESKRLQAKCMLAIARNALKPAAATCKMRRRGVPCLLDHSVHVVRGMLHGRSVYVACCMAAGGNWPRHGSLREWWRASRCARGDKPAGRGVSDRVGSVTFEVHRKIGIEFDLWMDTVTRSAHQAAEHGVCAGWKVCP